jgi:diaminohydroxyphosphoribosylaminopyrimidine deaminase/5-amino-6-(5-phosphoribosylamino)uracil reductase
VLAAGVWDELLIYAAPKLLGSSARPLAELALSHMSEAIPATIVDRAAVGEDVRLRLRPASEPARE